MLRFAVLALVALAFVLAGCLSSDDADDGPRAAVDDGAWPTVSFLPPVDLLCPAEGISQIQDLVQGECGQFGEPVIEVAGYGAVWASATCCIGRSPPIWVSRDGGESFQLLPFADRTGIVRDAFGIEGDFAIDDAGNVYFFDISAATTWFSKYEADGTHVFTKADIFPPLVDRPWVRAGRADEVWVFYNTGSATNLFHSTDGGMTWSLTPVGFECGLMTIGQGPTRDRLFVAGCTSAPELRVSEDGGATFGTAIRLPTPPGEYKDGTATDPFMPPVSDAAGNLYVFFEHYVDEGEDRVGIFLDVVRTDGSVTGPHLISTTTNVNAKPWPAAGRDGSVAVAWYGTEATLDANGAVGDDAEWYLLVAASFDGASDSPTFQVTRADPEPVLRGEFGRALGDFLQSDVGPDGRHYVIYAKRDATALTNRVVISQQALFGPGVPANGP